MSKFTRHAGTSQMLSVTAMEEASRRGKREADLEDLFLALVLDGQAAGRALRNLGITIHTGRAAVEACQQEQIAALGITADLPAPGNIVFHETGGYEWSKRASAVLGKAGTKGHTGDGAEVLRQLLAEPSGLITEVLHRLGVAPAAVLRELARIESTAPGKDSPTRRRGELAGSIECFVPAAIRDVWELVADPARIPEWEPAISTVEAAGEPVAPGQTLMAHARTQHPDGRPLKVKEKFRRRGIELVDAREPEQVSWRFTHPDAEAAIPSIVDMELRPTAGGTQLVISMTWFRHHGWRALLGTLLRPLQRFLIWIRLSQISSSISRTFRQS